MALPTKLNEVEGRGWKQKVINASTDFLTASNSGVAATGVTAEEFGDDYQHVTKLTIAAFTQATASAALAFGRKIYDFPIGHIKVNRALMKITISSPTQTVVGELALGTVVASLAAATTGGTATFENIIDGTANTATSLAGALTVINKAAEADVPDGSSTALDLYLNAAGTWTATENLTISGEITLFWDYLGT